MRIQPRILLTGLSILLAMGAIVATVLILRGVSGLSSSDFGSSVAWFATPYLLLILIARMASSNTISAGVTLVGTILTSGIGIYALYDAFYLHPENGMFAVLLPLLQWMCCGLTVAAILVMFFMKWLVLPQRGTTTTTK